MKKNITIITSFFMGLATGIGMWAAYRYGERTRAIAKAWDARLSRPAED
jgi:hypothetical protein